MTASMVSKGSGSLRLSACLSSLLGFCPSNSSRMTVKPSTHLPAFLSVLLVSSATALLWPALGPNFWKNNQPSFTKICLYSNDPSQFTPMCIMCPNTLYPIVLTTCVMGAAIPLNVSYTQANCIVGNCAVNMNLKPVKGKREAPETEPTDMHDLAEAIEGPVSVRSVPYTMMVDGHNVTITSVEEYFVHNESLDAGEEEEEEELEI